MSASAYYDAGWRQTVGSGTASCNYTAQPANRLNGLALSSSSGGAPAVRIVWRVSIDRSRIAHHAPHRTQIDAPRDSTSSGQQHGRAAAGVAARAQHDVQRTAAAPAPARARRHGRQLLPAVSAQPAHRRTAGDLGLRSRLAANRTVAARLGRAGAGGGRVGTART